MQHSSTVDRIISGLSIPAGNRDACFDRERQCFDGDFCPFYLDEKIMVLKKRRVLLILKLSFFVMSYFFCIVKSVIT